VIAAQQTAGLIPILRRLYAAKIDIAVGSDADGGLTVAISKKPRQLGAVRHFASKELYLASEWLERTARDLYQLEQISDAARRPTCSPACVRSIMDYSVSDTSDTTHLKLARRRVAEAEARVAAQRKRVRKLAATGHGWPEAVNILLTFEKVLSTMRTHLEFEERWHGDFLPAS